MDTIRLRPAGSGLAVTHVSEQLERCVQACQLLIVSLLFQSALALARFAFGDDFSHNLCI
jgi:hypothetical protein